MLRKQRADLAQAILAHGFQADAFTEGYWPGDVVGWDSPEAYAVTHGRYSFAIRERDGPGNFTVFMRPGTDSRSEQVNRISWARVRGLFDLWAERAPA